jgi:hypothetical protein
MKGSGSPESGSTEEAFVPIGDEDCASSLHPVLEPFSGTIGLWAALKYLGRCV